MSEPHSFHPPRRDSNQGVWIPPAAPLPHLPDVDADSFDPAKRGGPSPGGDGKDPNTPFGAFVKALHDCAVEYNDAVHISKTTTCEDAYGLACEKAEWVSKAFAAVIADMTTHPREENSTFVEPVLNAGYIVDLRIIAHMTKTEKSDGPLHGHSSSMVSLISGSSSGSGVASD